MLLLHGPVTLGHVVYKLICSVSNFEWYLYNIQMIFDGFICSSSLKFNKLVKFMLNILIKFAIKQNVSKNLNTLQNIF